MSHDPLTDLPPSSKLLYKLLEYESPLTQQELIERSMLASRTVRDALRRLRDHGVVERRRYPPDPRQNVYELRDEAVAADPPAAVGEAGD